MFTYSFIYVNGGGTDPLDDDPKNLNVLTFSAMVEDKGTFPNNKSSTIISWLAILMVENT